MGFGAMIIFNKIKRQISLVIARRLAKKRGMDFHHNCVFPEQLRSLGKFDHGDIVRVPMTSGKTGLYKAIMTKIYETDQRDWRFEFQGYDKRA